MSRSRIDISYINTAHKDLNAISMMSMMMAFEQDLSDAQEHIGKMVKEKSFDASLVKTMNTSLESSLKMGARDLEAASRRVLKSFASGETAKIQASILLWSHITEETRTANTALFQVCQLFGRSLNGKWLPTADEISDAL